MKHKESLRVMMCVGMSVRSRIEEKMCVYEIYMNDCKKKTKKITKNIYLLYYIPETH